jgi:hypothetical protein
MDIDRRILIGGNHLANALIGTEIPNNFANYQEALAAHGQPYADMWVCWRAIMDVRDDNSLYRQRSKLPVSR